MFKQKYYFISFLFLLTIFSCRKSEKIDIMGELQNIKGVTVRKIDADTSFNAYYEMYFTQAVDHNKPDGATFRQRVLLGFKSVDKPVVVELQGYNIWTPKAGELCKLINTNQLSIEHRFFKDSSLDSIPYAYLNIKQAAADQHKIIQSLKSIFKNKWISTGISKGGQTTIYHRYFYPKDVDYSVAYVAPMNLEREDKRIHTHLNSVGSDVCRKKIKDFQISLFKHKAQILPLLEDYCREKKLSFSISNEKLLDLVILEYPFSFWQWGHEKEIIPHINSSNKDLFYSLISVSSPSFFSKEGIQKEQAFFYQALTEIGMYSYEVAPFSEYLSYKKDLTFDFSVPKNVNHTFNKESMLKVNHWLQTEAKNMMFIGGQYDPWNATSVDLKGNTNCVKFTNPQGSHTTRIHSFPKNIQAEIISILEKSLDIKI